MKVLKFGAVWCAGCLVMRPRWQEIEKQNPWLETEYFDFDEDKEMVEKYKIDKNLPTFVYLDKNGQEFDRMTGEVSRKKLLAFVLESRDK